MIDPTVAMTAISSNHSAVPLRQRADVAIEA